MSERLIGERYPFGFMIDGLRVHGIDEVAGPKGRQAISIKLGDGSHLLAYADDDPGNPTGVRLDWVPAHWTAAGGDP